MKAKKKKTNLEKPIVIEDGKILKFGKLKKQKEIEDIVSTETQNFQRQDVIGIKKTFSTIDFSEIDINNSKKYQYRQNSQENINNLLSSINQEGILTPLSVCKSDALKIGEKDKYLLLEGFTRHECINILRNENKVKEMNIILSRDFKNYSIPVIIYENENGSPLTEEQRNAISVTQNNKRANWNGRDITLFYFEQFKKEVYKKVMGNKSNSEKAKESLDVIFKHKNFKLILNSLSLYDLLSENEIAMLKEKMLQELSEMTNYKKNELINLLKLIGLSETYWKIINGEDNPFGLQVPIKYAINLFLGKKGELLSDSIIEKKLKSIQRNVNPRAKGIETVKAKDIKQTENKKSKNKLDKSEKDVLVLLIQSEFDKTNVKKIDCETFINVLNAFNTIDKKAELIEAINKDLKIKLPDIDEE